MEGRVGEAGCEVEGREGEYEVEGREGEAGCEVARGREGERDKEVEGREGEGERDKEEVEGSEGEGEREVFEGERRESGGGLLRVRVDVWGREGGAEIGMEEEDEGGFGVEL